MRTQGMWGWRGLLWLLAGMAALAVAGCGSPVPLMQTSPQGPDASVGVARPPVPSVLTDSDVSMLPVLLRGNSRWVPVTWNDLPGFARDDLFEAWNAWLKSCERPGPVFASLCPELRRLSIGDGSEQRAWMQSNLQPYRVELRDGAASGGLLTAYFEPEFVAQRVSGAGFDTPLYKLPAGVGGTKPWFSRREMDTLPAAQEALRGQELLYLADPVDALQLQIQGSGRIRVTEPDGTTRLVRLAFAGHNGQPYQSVGRWLLDRGELRDASWPGIRAWLAQNPQRVQELLWQNPRVVFFKEEPLGDFDAGFGPRGAQGVPLTPGRSIAVDPQSIPYGTPVWLSSQGDSVSLNRLVLAQDTGSAITGALRADYFVGWGAAAGEVAGRLKQPLRLWALWPKAAR